MNLPGKRLILGSAVAVAALGVGGIAYAAGNDPVPEQGYVTVDDDVPRRTVNHGGAEITLRSAMVRARRA